MGSGLILSSFEADKTRSAGTWEARARMLQGLRANGAAHSPQKRKKIRLSARLKLQESRAAQPITKTYLQTYLTMKSAVVSKRSANSNSQSHST